MSATPRTPSFRLEGKRALVVGASSGIGLACAAALAEAGAEVTAAARDHERLSNAIAGLDIPAAQITSIPLDITDVAATDAIVEALEPFDILVNSAGMARHGPALDTEAADFDAVFAVNVRGAYFLTRAVARRLLQARRSGSLINISSQMSKVGGIDRAVYAATKHAVEGFTKSMAIEWGKSGIRVNTVCPTFIMTALTRSTFEDPERARWISGKIKLDRIGQVEDVMGAVVYLASDASAMVTGTSLMIDGGWTAG